MGPKYHIESLCRVALSYLKNTRPLKNHELDESERSRLDHYFKIREPFTLPEPTHKSVPLLRKTLYSYDFWQCLGRPNPSTRFHYEFGDVRNIPSIPTFVKSRPIKPDNQNAVLLPLETERHFKFVKDPYQFKEKRDLAVFRGACYQPWRQHFLEAASRSSLVDAGDTARSATDPKYWKSFISIKDQLKYKFIISLEGNDVASNLKWAMASNSVVIMPKPKFETWFCESRLVPGLHYLELQADCSNLDDLIEFALMKPKATREIIDEANHFCAPFMNKQRQVLLGRTVIGRYFQSTTTRSENLSDAPNN